MFKKIITVLAVVACMHFPAKADSRILLYPLLAMGNFIENPYSGKMGPELPEEAFPGNEAPEDMAIAFSTERLGEGALLTWDLPQPTEVTSLIIEGSEDGAHFIDLESLEKTEAGVLDVFYDATPNDRRYYRLIANYKDGIQKVTPAQVLAPATAFDALLDKQDKPLLVVTADAPVMLYNLQGQLITTATPWEGKCEFELDSLPHGPYLIRAGSNRKVIFY